MKSTPSGSSPIEALEARIAPAALFTFTDVDGDHASVTTSKGTNAQLSAVVHLSAPNALGGAALDSIDLAANPIFAGTTLSVFAKRGPVGGDGLVNVGLIDATSLDLGAVFVGGDLQQILAGKSAATSRLPSITVNSMSSGAPSVINASVGAFTIRHDAAGADLQVNGSVNLLKIGGSIIGGASANQGLIDVYGVLKTAVVGGSLLGAAGASSGALEAHDIGLVLVRGSVLGAGGDSSGMISTVGHLGVVHIGGDLLGGASQNAGTVQVQGGNLQAAIIGGSVGGGSATGDSINVDFGAIGLVRIGHDLLGGNADAGIYSNQSIGAVVIAGSVTAGPAGARTEISAETRVGSIVIGGDVNATAGGGVFIGTEGDAITGAVAIKGSILEGTSGAVTIFAEGIGAVRVGHDIVGNSAAPVTIDESYAGDLGVLSVGGSVDRLNVVLGGAGAQLGAVHVGGAWTASNLRVGVNPGTDGLYGTADDTGVTPNPSGKPSEIHAVIIGGPVSGAAGGGESFRFEAEQIGFFLAGGVKFPLVSGPHNDTNPASPKLEVGATGDVQIQEVVAGGAAG